LFIQFLLIAILTTSSDAADKIAYITSVKGEVRLKSEARKRQGKWLRVKREGVRVFSGDEFKILSGRVEVTFSDGSTLLARDNSNFSLEEKPTQRTVFGFAKKWRTNRNVAITYGTVEADIKQTEEKWTSFETRSALAGITGATVALEVDAFGNMQFSCENGFAELANSDASVIFDMQSGKETRIEATDNNETQIKSIKGAILIKAGFAKIAIGDMDGVTVGTKSLGRLFIATLEGNRGVVTVTSGNTTATLDSAKAVLISKHKSGALGVKAVKGNLNIIADGAESVLTEGQQMGEIESDEESLEEISDQPAKESESLQTTEDDMKLPAIVNPEIPDPPEQDNAASPSSL